MEFFRIKRDIPFMSWGKYTTTISLITFILSVFFLASKGLNLGVDFTGGTVMEVGYSQTADLNRVRDVVVKLGMGDASVQNFGTSRDVLIRLPTKPEMSSARLSETVLSALKQDDSTVEMRRVEFVGPQVGNGAEVEVDLVAEFFPEIVGQTAAARGMAASSGAWTTARGAERLIDRDDDVGDANLLTDAGQLVAAARAADAAHQVVAAQLAEQLLEVGERDLLALGDLGQGYRPVGAVNGEVSHRHHRVSAS